MTTKIVIKNSTTATAEPTTGDIDQGELAINLADKRLFSRDDSNNIVLIGIQDGTGDGNAMRWDASSGAWVETSIFTISAAGLISVNALNGLSISNLPTSDPSVAGRIWNDSGVLKVSAG